MNKLQFIIVQPIIWFFSHLPMPLLYLLSDFLFILVYYIIGYRKKVVYNNLKLCFPEKKEIELKKLTKKSLRHFCDFLVENIKAFGITKKESIKRFTYKNPEALNDAVNKGKNIILTTAHLSNWEWATGMPFITDIQLHATYQEIKNEHFENLVKKSRNKFGGIPLSIDDTIPTILRNLRKGKKGAYILLSDQSPQLHKANYWHPFFGVNVPVHTGVEVIAKKFDMTIINFSSKKIKRGYYEVTFELVTETPKDYKNYELTDKYLEITERNIKEQPDLYMWTHKRFKHKDKHQEWLELQNKKTAS